MAKCFKRKIASKQHESDPGDKPNKPKKSKTKDRLSGNSGGVSNMNNSGRNSNGTFKIQWCEGDDVYLKLNDNSWVEAKIQSVITNSCDMDPLKGGTSKLTILYKIPDGSGEGIVHVYNSDYHAKLRKMDAIEMQLEGKPEQAMYQALSKLLSNDEQITLQDEFKKSGKFTFEMMFKTVVASDGKSFNALKEISETILQDKHARSAIEEVLHKKI